MLPRRGSICGRSTQICPWVSSRVGYLDLLRHAVDEAACWPHCPVRSCRSTARPFPRKREQLDTFKGLLPESHGHNLALTALYVPYSHKIGVGFEPRQKHIHTLIFCVMLSTKRLVGRTAPFLFGGLLSEAHRLLYHLT
jgi:hypothetical protein